MSQVSTATGRLPVMAAKVAVPAATAASAKAIARLRSKRTRRDQNRKRKTARRGSPGGVC